MGLGFASAHGYPEINLSGFLFRSGYGVFFRGTLAECVRGVWLSGHRSPAAPCTAVIRRHCLSGIIGYGVVGGLQCRYTALVGNIVRLLRAICCIVVARLVFVSLFQSLDFYFATLNPAFR